MKIKNFKYFYPEKPRLVNIDQPLVETISKDKDWVAEKKYNDRRLELHFFDNAFQYWGRYGEKLVYSPDDRLAEALYKLPLSGYCLFDGCLRHNKVKRVRNKIILFDTLIWKDELLIGVDFWERRKLLEGFLDCEAEPVGIPVQYTFNFRQVFQEVIVDPEIEGLIFKNRHGRLNLGRVRSSDSRWMWKARRPSGSYRF